MITFSCAWICVCRIGCERLIFFEAYIKRVRISSMGGRQRQQKVCIDGQYNILSGSYDCESNLEIKIKRGYIYISGFVKILIFLSFFL
jgi:hypothetical protein